MFRQNHFSKFKFLIIFIFYRDDELRALIKQDVDRTIPEVAFFQSNKIRKIMCDILFIYAKSKYLTDLCTVSGKNFTGSISMIIFSRSENRI